MCTENSACMHSVRHSPNPNSNLRTTLRHQGGQAECKQNGHLSRFLVTDNKSAVVLPVAVFAPTVATQGCHSEPVTGTFTPG